MFLTIHALQCDYMFLFPKVTTKPQFPSENKHGNKTKKMIITNRPRKNLHYI